MIKGVLDYLILNIIRIKIRVSTKECIKRQVRIKTKLSDEDLMWCEMEYSDYPKIDPDLEGITWKDEVIGDKVKRTYLPFKIKDGRTKPSELKIGSFVK